MFLYACMKFSNNEILKRKRKKEGSSKGKQRWIWSNANKKLKWNMAEENQSPHGSHEKQNKGVRSKLSNMPSLNGVGLLIVHWLQS